MSSLGPNSTVLQLTRLVQIVQELCQKEATVVVFLQVARAFNTAWVDGLYKLTLLNFVSYRDKTISSYLNSPMFEASFQIVTPTCCIWASVDQGGIISPR
jgi:hypothetical protein